MEKIKRNIRTVDLEGQVFGKLTVVEFAGYKKTKNGSKKALWLCKCVCGNGIIVAAINLKRKSTKSCGCLKHGTGENNPNYNPNYNPNLTDEQRDINKNRFRNDLENTNWIKAVLKRDNYTCRKCGRINCYLEAHHLENWADNSKLQYNIDNGIAFCKECHRIGLKSFHKIYGRKHITKKQTLEFLKK